MTDYLSLSLEINRLEEKLKEAEEKLKRALEIIYFYAEAENWDSRGFNSNDTICDTDLTKDENWSYGGKRARDFLKEINNV